MGFRAVPKLISQLYEESIFISIGHREFQIPRDIFTDPGNTPNFFSLGFAAFFSNPADNLFPGLDREGLIRPPSILPPSVPNRSADTFAEILHFLKGYPVHIRNEAHRAELLRDCRYFNFKGLEQKLIPHHIGFNLERNRLEISIRVQEILKSGISVAPDPAPPGEMPVAWVNYARPYVDDKPAELVLEIGGEATKLYFSHGSVRAEFFRDTRARITRLFEVIATKLDLPPTTQPLGLLMGSGGASSPPATPGSTPLSEDLVKVLIEPDTAITLDGRAYMHDRDEGAVSVAAAGMARRIDSFARADGGELEAWVVRTGQWRLRIQGASGGSGLECVLVGVKIDAVSSEQARNAAKGFLGG